MTLDVLKMVMKCGDQNGSALRELLKHYKIKDNDLSPITDDMALRWLDTKMCSCYHDGKCWGTREKDEVACKGNKTKCIYL
jgi:hypothetical protein